MGYAWYAFPCIADTLNLLYTNGLDDCMGQLQCRLGTHVPFQHHEKAREINGSLLSQVIKIP